MNAPAKAKHTKGPVCIETPMDDLWIVKANQQSYEWEPLATIPLEYETSGITKVQARANANLFVEAINVATETGLSPRNLATHRAELLAALKGLTHGLPELLKSIGYTDEEQLIEKALAVISNAEAV